MQKEAHERDPSELSYFMVPRESQPKRMPLMFTVTSTSFSSTRTGIFLLCCDTVWFSRKKWKIIKKKKIGKRVKGDVWGHCSTSEPYGVKQEIRRNITWVMLLLLDTAFLITQVR